MKDDPKNGDEEITLRMVINHMQHGFGVLRTDIKELSGRMDRLEKKVDTGFADLRSWQRWLDSLDIQQRVSDLEDKVFAGVDPQWTP